MKFGRRFENSKIPEWADFYVNYRVLKKLLSPYKFVGQCNQETFLFSLNRLSQIKN